jgi:glucose-6-phosphate isomerase
MGFGRAALLANVTHRGTHMTDTNGFTVHPGEFEKAVEDALAQVRDDNIMDRIWSHDHTVWKDDPADIENRLGWLHCPENMADALPEIQSFAREVSDAGFTHALLLGMGGSSLTPEMFRLTFGVAKGFLNLAVLDSTDPRAVLGYAGGLDPERTLFIVSTKSGGTVETLSFMKFFYNHVADSLGEAHAGEHFVAITDPGSSLEAAAGDLHFRKTFLNDPEIGGRYSALSYFGLAPAGIIGADVHALLKGAGRMAKACRGPAGPDRENKGALLGAVLGRLALEGRDKLTLITSPALSSFGAWVEQLVAESTGKEGTGIVPVDGEPVLGPEFYAGDRLFVRLGLEGDRTHDDSVGALKRAGHPVVDIRLKDLRDLGGECFRWEMATAVAGGILGINPFDQPNVESAKVSARKMLAAFQEKGRLPEPGVALEQDGIRVYADFSPKTLSKALDRFFAQAGFGKDGYRGRSYLALQAYLRPSEDTDRLLQAIRAALLKRYHMATTLGYGPRFLHSTGQLHKGDAGNGLFVQILDGIAQDAPIPDEPGSKTSSVSFGVLKRAQALGDRQALLDAGRKVIGFHVGQDITGGLERLLGLIR